MRRHKSMRIKFPTLSQSKNHKGGRVRDPCTLRKLPDWYVIWAPLIFSDSYPTNAFSSFTWASASQNQKEWTYDRSLEYDHKKWNKYCKLKSESHPPLILKWQESLLTLCLYPVDSGNVIHVLQVWSLWF